MQQRLSDSVQTERQVYWQRETGVQTDRHSHNFPAPEVGTADFGSDQISFRSRWLHPLRLVPYYSETLALPAAATRTAPIMSGRTAENKPEVSNSTSSFRALKQVKKHLCEVRGLPEGHWLLQKGRRRQGRRCCGCTGGSGKEMARPTERTVNSPTFIHDWSNSSWC